MEQAIREAYSPEVLRLISARHGIDPGHALPLDGFENFIYEVTRKGSPYVLRISHIGLRRSLAQICAEVDFINYLSHNGVPVAKPVASPNGAYVETGAPQYPDFAGVLFEKAPGGPPRRQHWTPAFLDTYGKTMGRMHRLTKCYIPRPGYSRPHGMDDLQGFAEKFLPPRDLPVVEKWNALLDWLKTLPTGVNDYGLIHQDLHGGNFFVHDAGNAGDTGAFLMTVFDFDDCQYFWFAHDIAMALFYILPHRCDAPEHLDQARVFMRHFMQGYRRENHLDRRWLREIPGFMRLREIDLYIAIHRSLDLDHLDAWCQSFMDGRRERILQEVPYVGVDFSDF